MMRSLIIIFLFISCTVQSQLSVDETKSLITYCDDLVKSKSNQIQTYISFNEQQPPEKILNLNATDESYESFLKVIKIDGEIRLYETSPYSESGDWNNVYSYYFDIKGNIIALRKESSFFNSVCDDGVLTETSLDYYIEGNIILSEYELINDKGIVPEDTTLCVFNYRFDGPIFTSVKDIPHYAQL